MNRIHPRLLARSLYSFALFAFAVQVVASAPLEPDRSAAEDAESKSVLPVTIGEGHRAGICLPEHPSQSELEAAEKLQSYVLKATGIQMPLVRESKRSQHECETWIFIGDQEENRKAGLSPKDLEQEQYVVKAGSGKVHLLGRDRDYQTPPSSDTVLRSAATKWAVNYLADRVIGVRWLWPGELGTHVPKLKTIVIPAIDTRLKPDLELRRLRVGLYRPKYDDGTWMLDSEMQTKIKAEARGWLEDHQMGSRARFGFAHSFIGWWDRFSKTDPDLFAIPPSSKYVQPYPQAKAVKLRLANPAILEKIAEDYRAAGAPAYWNVAPNDGIGFDTSAETRAWDQPTVKDKESIWAGQTSLTARYVTFWNKVYERLSRINPDVTLTTLVYGAYRNPPLGKIALKTKLIAAFVHSYTARDEWKYWSDQGARLVLRPNWWVVGGSAPHLPLKQEGNFLTFARNNGLIGVDFDSLIGYWGVQGPRYYVVARMISRPDLSLEEILTEYTSAFGAASEHIRAYLDYWQDYSEKAAYPITAGGAIPVDPEGLFETAVRQVGFPHMPLANSSVMIPYLYPDEVIQPAMDILDDATKAAKGDEEATQRVAFLREGLNETIQVRELLSLAMKLRDGGTSVQKNSYETLRANLREMRKILSLKGVIWGDSVYEHEKRRKVPTFPEFIQHQAYDLKEEGK